jgi:hypothetical protein
LPQAWTGTWLLLTLTTLCGLPPSDIVAALAIGAAKPSSPAVATVSARAWVFLSITSRSPFFAIYRQTGSGDEFVCPCQSQTLPEAITASDEVGSV